MGPFTNVIGASLFTAALGVGLGVVIFGRTPDGAGLGLVLGCVGAIVGALAGCAREVATAMRQKPSL